MPGDSPGTSNGHSFKRGVYLSRVKSRTRSPSNRSNEPAILNEMPYPVRCPVCRDVTRVAAPAVGYRVTCPTCDTEFRAVPEAKVRSVGPMALSADGSVPRPTGLLFFLALVPFALPFLWVLAPY